MRYTLNTKYVVNLNYFINKYFIKIKNTGPIVKAKIIPKEIAIKTVSIIAKRKSKYSEKIEIINYFDELPTLKKFLIGNIKILEEMI